MGLVLFLYLTTQLSLMSNKLIFSKASPFCPTQKFTSNVHVFILTFLHRLSPIQLRRAVRECGRHLVASSGQPTTTLQAKHNPLS